MQHKGARRILHLIRKTQQVAPVSRVLIRRDSHSNGRVKNENRRARFFAETPSLCLAAPLDSRSLWFCFSPSTVFTSAGVKVVFSCRLPADWLLAGRQQPVTAQSSGVLEVVRALVT